MERPDVPTTPAPIEATVRAVPTLDPRELALGGLAYGLVLAVGWAIRRAIVRAFGAPGRTFDVRRGWARTLRSLDRRTVARLFLAGLGVAVVADVVRNRRTDVSVTPGWVVRETGETRRTVPREDVEHVDLDRTVLDRLLGTGTVVVHHRDGELRLPALSQPEQIADALESHRD